MDSEKHYSIRLAGIMTASVASLDIAFNNAYGTDCEPFIGIDWFSWSLVAVEIYLQERFWTELNLNRHQYKNMALWNNKFQAGLIKRNGVLRRTMSRYIFDSSNNLYLRTRRKREYK